MLKNLVIEDKGINHIMHDKKKLELKAYIYHKL